MSEYALLLLAFFGGILLGLIFFGGLRWTVRKGMSSAHPWLWFFASLVFRVALVMAGFYLIAGGDWRRAAVCVIGFIAVRVVLVRKTLKEEGKSVSRMDS